MFSGNVIAMPLSGFLANDIGWESVFYVEGGMGMVVVILWIFLVFDMPMEHPRIPKVCKYNAFESELGKM